MVAGAIGTQRNGDFVLFRPRRRSAVQTGSALMNSHPRRLIVGITGASGAVYGVRLLRLLAATDIETHLVMSRSAKVTLTQELDIGVAEVSALAKVVHQVDNIGASISSGSFRTLGMVIAPCSMRSLAEIASGVTSSLVTRAADVVLKERRRLVLIVREAPLHLGHLRSMTAATEMGAIVYPPVPAFYARPENLEQMVDHTLGRVLDLFDIETQAVSRWGGLNSIKNGDS
jgi:4-hydroxy-3-polyprenylbenzoate decarboxylase